MKRVKKFGVYQTSKVAAVIMFFIALLFLIPVMLISRLAGGFPGGHYPGFPFGGFFIIVMPFIYAIFGFIFTAISCVIYNVIAKWTGGIELEFETTENQVSPE